MLKIYIFEVIILNIFNMIAKQEVKLGMYNVICSSLEAQTAIVENFTAFYQSFQRFKAKVNAISIIAQQEDLIILGFAQDKSHAKMRITAMGADIASLIYAYAVEINSPLLKNEVNYSLSKLRKTKDDLLPVRLKNIYERGVTHRSALEEYGINEQLLESFNDLIEAYKEKVPNPRRGVSTKKNVKSNMKLLFKEADEILKQQMDKRIVALKIQYPDFVSEYKSNRMLIDATRTTTQFKGIVISSADGSRVSNATVQLDNTLFQSFSDENGTFVIKDIPFGSYTTTAISEGHETIAAFPIQIKRGKINKIKFSMIPTAQ